MKKFLKVLVLTICFVMVSQVAFAMELIGGTWDLELDSTDTINLIAPNSSPNEIRVQLNGEIVDFTDENGNKVEPQIINDRTMVPMRKIFEVFGANVEWIGEEQRVIAKVENAEIGLQINNSKATVKNASGEVTEITLDSVPVIKDGRTLVPVRFIAESLNKKVGWDSFNRAVIIIDTDFISETLKEKTPTFYEYLTTEYKKLTTYDMTVALDGKVVMKDKTDSKNDSSLNIGGDMKVKFSLDAINIKINLALSGKGVLIADVKESGYENINAEMILDIKNGVVYVTSPLIKGYENKWISIKLDEDETAQINETMKLYSNNQNNNTIETLIDALLLQTKDGMSLYTYSTLESAMEVITFAMNDNNFKVSGKDTKKYTFNLDLSEELTLLLKSLTNNKIDTKLVIKFDNEIKDGVETKANASFDFKVENSEMFVNAEVKANGKLNSYNENVNITIPTGSNVIDAENVEF